MSGNIVLLDSLDFIEGDFNGWGRFFDNSVIQEKLFTHGCVVFEFKIDRVDFYNNFLINSKAFARTKSATLEEVREKKSNFSYFLNIFFHYFQLKAA
jgi:hypothetical protein